MTGGKTAFVLSGGGSLGAVQVGMLAELLQAGLAPDLIVGVSAGAINGAYLAARPSLHGTTELAHLWRRLRTRDVLGGRWHRTLGLVGLRECLVSGRHLREFLAQVLPIRTLEEAEVPLIVVASDQHTGEEVLIRQGDALEAVLASAAIPGVFPPVRHGSRLLIDGAVASGTPVGAAVRAGAERVFVLPCGFTCVADAIPRHAIGRAMHALTLIAAQRLRNDFETYRERARVYVIPPPCPQRCAAHDYSVSDTLIEAGRDSAKRWLEAGGVELTGFPDQLLEHQHR